MYFAFYLISRRCNWLIELVEIQTMLLVHQSKSVPFANDELLSLTMMAVFVLEFGAFNNIVRLLCGFPLSSPPTTITAQKYAHRDKRNTHCFPKYTLKPMDVSIVLQKKS